VQQEDTLFICNSCFLHRAKQFKFTPSVWMWLMASTVVDAMTFRCSQLCSWSTKSSGMLWSVGWLPKLHGITSQKTWMFIYTYTLTRSNPSIYSFQILYRHVDRTSWRHRNLEQECTRWLNNCCSQKGICRGSVKLAVNITPGWY
jgi:hypothetical protein